MADLVLSVDPALVAWLSRQGTPEVVAARLLSDLATRRSASEGLPADIPSDVVGAPRRRLRQIGA